MKTIIAITPGLDSSYLLWKKLSQTTDDITAVNFDTFNVDQQLFIKYDVRGFTFEDATLAQTDKLNLIIDWLQKNVRPFTFVNEIVSADYMSTDLALPNNTQSYFVRYALPKINTGELDKIASSSQWDNDGCSFGGSVGKSGQRPGSWTALEVFQQFATRGTLEFTLLDMDYNPAYALSEMPKELLDIIIYPARQTVYKNLQAAWYKQQLNEGKTPAEAGVISKANCTLPNGKWKTMRAWLQNWPDTPSTVWNMPSWPTSYTVP